MAKKLEIMGTLKQTPVQPDWNQNDPNAPDYVKNRTHWEEIVTGRDCVIENMSFTGDSAHIDLNIWDFSLAPLEFYAEFDGETYPVSVSGSEQNTQLTFGQISIKQAGELVDAGYYQPNGSDITGAGEGDHNFSLYIDYTNTVIHSIDKKYLPPLAGEIHVGSDGFIEGETFNDYTNNIASGLHSHAEGSNTTASGGGSHAEGSNTTASGGGSHAEGSNTTASGFYSHAEGHDTTASEYTSHAEGHDTTASGSYSHAEGDKTTASGSYSHAEGDKTTASEYSSHAEGCRTTASGSYSHAEGLKTHAIGGQSHSEGHGTIAKGNDSHVEGRWNIEDSNNKYAHIVGNGTNDANRSNAHTLDWDGNAWYAGTIEGTALILKSSTPDSTKRFKITVDDSGTISASAID